MGIYGNMAFHSLSYHSSVIINSLCTITFRSLLNYRIFFLSERSWLLWIINTSTSYSNISYIYSVSFPIERRPWINRGALSHCSPHCAASRSTFRSAGSFAKDGTSSQGFDGVKPGKYHVFVWCNGDVIFLTSSKWQLNGIWMKKWWVYPDLWWSNGIERTWHELLGAR